METEKNPQTQKSVLFFFVLFYRLVLASEIRKLKSAKNVRHTSSTHAVHSEIKKRNASDANINLRG